ncbi:MAG: hypothetical protein A2148_04850 [Chloroflexi bacterium RBG_16_68_14]|nr:MAG: hypothetical protein A2148_04850 [Chloroflexi bacterium RBG_16_68_14]
MRWLRRFFYSDDEVVKLADGLSEFDAGIAEELLANEGIIAMKKNMEAVYDRYWRPMLPSADNFALFVKQSDVKRAIEVLELALDPRQLRRRARERRFRRR